MCAKLHVENLNPDFCLSYPTRTCSCKVIIILKVCGDIYAKLTNKLDY